MVGRRGAARVIEACDARALELGLRPGTALADARARFPDLAIEETDPEGDERLVARLADACERFTPMVALDPPHGLMLDVTGCTHLFGGEAALAAEIVARCARSGLVAKVALADGPATARALVRFADGGIVAAGGSEVAVGRLPIAALEVGTETHLALRRAGFRTLADLDAHPSVLFSARFGEATTRRLAEILGRVDRRITPLRPPPDCMVERHFPEPLVHSPSLRETLVHLVDEAGEMLERRGQGGRLFEATFFRSDGVVRRIAVGTGRPVRETAVVMRLFDERLAALADPLDPGWGFDALRLSVPAGEALTARQPTLDGRVNEERALTDLLDRLVARFGRDRVLRFVARDTHWPERAADAVSIAEGGPREGAAWEAPLPGDPPARPLALFDPPQPIETLAEVPDGPPMRFRWRRVLHEIVRAEGPERIAPEWWRDGADEPTRDYYRIEDATGHRFWVFRSGLFGEAEAPRWFVHGLFA